MKQSLYDLVGVPPEAPREMVAAACRRRIAQLEREATDEAKAGIYAVREAWSILGDDKLRAGYDASLAAAKDAPEPGRRPATQAELASASFATELLKPRHVLAENWERYRKLVFVMLFVGFLALSAAWNESRRKAIEKRLEDATYEAEYGKTREEAAKEAAQAAAPEKPAEPFSAEKFEQELKAREAAIQDQVVREQTAKEDEFREKLQQENDPRAARRRARNR
ncbi:MAG: hypothetical protein AB7P08_00125 [Burkholderiales bacterium]